jgi:hypothetical protein
MDIPSSLLFLLEWTVSWLGFHPADESTLQGLKLITIGFYFSFNLGFQLYCQFFISFRLASVLAFILASISWLIFISAWLA